MKLATERVLEQSGLGWTTLRATQFHDLILMVARALAKLPVIPAPTGSRFQPVDATEVAGRMAELALGEPSGLVPDLAGPKICTVAELVNKDLAREIKELKTAFEKRTEELKKRIIEQRLKSQPKDL